MKKRENALNYRHLADAAIQSNLHNFLPHIALPTPACWHDLTCEPFSWWAKQTTVPVQHKRVKITGVQQPSFRIILSAGDTVLPFENIYPAQLSGIAIVSAPAVFPHIVVSHVSFVLVTDFILLQISIMVVNLSWLEVFLYLWARWGCLVMETSQS